MNVLARRTRRTARPQDLHAVGNRVSVGEKNKEKPQKGAYLPALAVTGIHAAVSVTTIATKCELAVPEARGRSP